MTLYQCGCEGTAHDTGCPFAPDYSTNPKPVNPKPVNPKPRGWVCPACGAGNAPWSAKCDCNDGPGFRIMGSDGLDAQDIVSN